MAEASPKAPIDDRARRASPRPPSAFGLYERALELADRLVSSVVIVLMAVLTTVLVVQVFLRYVLNTSLDWGWEVPRLCFIWAIFLSIPLGIKRGAHVGIDIVMRALPHLGRRALFRVHLTLMAIMMGVVFWYAIQLAVLTWRQLMPTLELSVGVFYIGLAWCAVHSVLHFVRLFVLGEPAEGALDE